MISEHVQPDPVSIGGLLDWGVRLLASNSTSPKLDAEVLMAALTHRSRSTVMAFPERAISRKLAKEFRALMHRRAKGIPLAYLTGHKEFYSINLRVSSDTLVPRPETEILVDQLLRHIAPMGVAKVLDLGTGCGAIALAIKQQRPNTSVVAVDASEAALSIASKNGSRLGLEVEWIFSSWFKALDEQQFGFIVSNPPYVGRGDPRLIDGVLRHEPREALDGGMDGVASIREIIAGAPRVLAPGGTLLLEQGNDQKLTVSKLLRANSFRSIETHQDLAGHDRVTLGRVA